MNFKDLGLALKETIFNGDALIAVSGIAIFAAAEAILNIKDTYSRVKIERNIKAFLDGLKDGDKDKLQTAINRIFQEANEEPKAVIAKNFEGSKNIKGNPQTLSNGPKFGWHFVTSIDS